MEAAGKGQLGLVKYLFQVKPHWLLGDLQEPLCKAMYRGHIHIMEFLIASATNADGQAPLMLATIQGSIWGNIFFKRGADVNKMNHQNRQTALMEAAINGSVKIAKFLIEAGDDVNIGNKFGHTVLILAENNIVAKVLIEAGADVNVSCANNETALLHCISGRNEKGVQLLVEAGANVNTGANLRNIALIVAVRKGHLSIAEVLEQGLM